MERHILLTGATGTIGSMHLLELLSRGYQVSCLIRGESEQARFDKLATTVGREVASQTKIINGEITRELAGVDPQVIAELKGRVDIVVHHAGSIKFDQKYLDEIMAANIGGTANMLALAEALEVTHFCYDSTAYVLNSEARNPYEVSKKKAEEMVLDWQFGQVMVWRPSIVVGRMTDGVTNGFNGYYGFLSGFNFLKYQLSKMWKKGNIDECQEQGFRFDELGRLILLYPLYIDYSRESTLNLVPVDWAVREMTYLMESATWGSVFNLVNVNPPKVAWAIEKSLEILGIVGVRRLPHEASPQSVQVGVPETFRIIQERINGQIERFWHYINYEKCFDSDSITEAPPVDSAFFQTMLEYAVAQRFGRV